MKTNIKILAFIIFLVVAKLATSQIDTTGFDSLVRSKCMFPEIVIAQSKLETGHFKCENCSWTNSGNPWGFYNGKRYLRYQTIEQAVDGMVEWQNWRCSECETEEEYFEALFNYWGAPKMKEYIQTVKNLMR